MSEATVRLAARLYESRDAAKTLLGDRYEATVREHMEFVLRKQQLSGKSELAAVTEIIKELHAQKSNGVTEIILIATVCEMVEGILALPHPGVVISYRITSDGKVAAGKGMVERHITSENKPEHLRSAQRMVAVRGMAGYGAGQKFLVTEKEIVK